MVHWNEPELSSLIVRDEVLQSSILDSTLIIYVSDLSRHPKYQAHICMPIKHDLLLVFLQRTRLKVKNSVIKKTTMWFQSNKLNFREKSNT